MAETKYLRPPRLRPGLRVALVAPAGPMKPERIEASVELCRSLGLEPVLGAHARGRTGYLAGRDEARAADMQQAIADPSIAAIWALRGGYGTVRLLEHLDLTPLRQQPKAYIGFSDNTTIHLALLQQGNVSFHGPHPGGDFPPETRAAFERVLFHPEPAGTLPLRPSDPCPRTLRVGTARGPLVGGNLSILASACGTSACLRASGCVMFIEDVGEDAYRVDRALMQLLRTGALTGAVALACGRFSDTPINENDRPVDEVLLEFADRLNIPAAVDFPFGHIEHNWTLPVGVMAELDASAATLTILEAAVT